MPVPGRIRLWSGLAFAGFLGGSLAFGQDSTTDPAANRPRTARPKLSESREDDNPAVAPSALKVEVTVKPAAEPSKPVGIFGDTKKFTRLGGWGSFGNAMGQYGFARATLIAMPAVQEELKLSDEQKKKLKEWQEGMRKKGEEMGRSLREQNGDDPFKATENQPITARIFQFQSMMNQFSSFIQENEAGLARILNAPQRKRLNQIALQMEGISAITRPEISETLGLFEDEVEQIQEILNNSRAQQMTTWIGSMMSMRPPQKPPTSTEPSTKKNSDPAAKPADPAGTPPDANDRAAREKAMKSKFESMRDRTDRIQAEAVIQISKILTKGQRAKFESLLGPPFDPSQINNLGRPPRGETPPVKPTDPPKS